MNSEICLPREVLEAPFPEGQVKTRPGAFGGSLSYLEGHTVIGRLNDAFDGNWSFEIMSHQILDEEVLVCGKFRAESAGVVKMAFGSSSITRDRQTGKMVNIGSDLKAAQTDALKKAATLLGVGLYLYAGGNGESAQADERPFDEDLRTRPARPGNGQSGNVNPQGGNGRITNRQVSAIFAIARERAMTNPQVRSLAQERFNRTVDYLSKIEQIMPDEVAEMVSRTGVRPEQIRGKVLSVTFRALRDAS